MEKTATLNLRINNEVKRNAEAVLSALGLSMSAAITIYLKQIALRGGIPFDLRLPKGPDSLNTDLMSAEEVRSFIDKGLDDIDKGKVVKAKKFFEDFRRTHAND
jgi:addiction module RelB/DinJ family antitoxin